MCRPMPSAYLIAQRWKYVVNKLLFEAKGDVDGCLLV